MDRTLEFVVEGSQGDPYDVAFWRQGNAAHASCTCEAGQNEMFCKHRRWLIDGDCSSLLSDNEDQVAEIPALLAGTEAEAALGELRIAERHYEAAQLALKARKQAVHRLLG